MNEQANGPDFVDERMMPVYPPGMEKFIQECARTDFFVYDMLEFGDPDWRRDGTRSLAWRSLDNTVRSLSDAEVVPFMDALVGSSFTFDGHYLVGAVGLLISDKSDEFIELLRSKSVSDDAIGKYWADAWGAVGRAPRHEPWSPVIEYSNGDRERLVLALEFTAPRVLPDGTPRPDDIFWETKFMWDP